MNATPSLNDLALAYVFSNPERIPWSKTSTRPEVCQYSAHFALALPQGVGTLVHIEYQHRTETWDCDCCGDTYRFNLNVTTDGESSVSESDLRLRTLTKNYFQLPMNRWTCHNGRWTHYESDLLTPVNERHSLLENIARFFKRAA